MNIEEIKREKLRLVDEIKDLQAKLEAVNNLLSVYVKENIQSELFPAEFSIKTPNKVFISHNKIDWKDGLGWSHKILHVLQNSKKSTANEIAEKINYLQVDKLDLKIIKKRVHDYCNMMVKHDRLKVEQSLDGTNLYSVK